MADKFSVEKRSEIMKHIKSKDTKIELQVRHWLFHNGIRYRKNYKAIPGRPDIAITKYKIAIFVNGCFWHAHQNCKLNVIPKTNTDFWIDKIEKNINRDKLITEKLISEGWSVIVLWECEIERDFENSMNKLLGYINDIKLQNLKKY